MTPPGLHVCRHCDRLIVDPDDAVEVAYVHANSGAGRVVWAHSAHAHLVQPDPYQLALLARIRALRAGNAAT